jgi:hypothetical protein
MAEPPISTTLSPPTKASPTALQCFSGSLVSGALTVLVYRLTVAIAVNFVRHSVHSDNLLVVRLSAALRTLVVGLSAMGTGIFGFVTLGLAGLGVQLLAQRILARSRKDV